LRNNLATQVVRNHPFLIEYVDASANNVNLSAKSHRIWSLSAVKTMVVHILENYPDDQIANEDKAAQLGEFFDALIEEMPQFKVLEAHRLELEIRRAEKKKACESATPALRERRGGDIALRGIGLVMFARAYLYCIATEMPFTTMAKVLAKVDWHVLDCERDQIVTDSDDVNIYHASVMKHANPIWRSLLVIKPRRYKISSSSADANACWELIVTPLMPQQVAAE
jgi:hypothetical protein